MPIIWRMMAHMWKARLGAVAIILTGVAVGYFVYHSELSEGARFPFRFGLDLTGGSHLVYEADVSEITAAEVPDAMQALRDVIERRVNLFGVSEPLVQVERASVFAQGQSDHRLIVELPGITDLSEAVRLIGATPQLEFKLVGDPLASTSEQRYVATGLTGRFLSRAQLEFVAPPGGSVPNEPVVVLYFNDEGATMFGDITSTHVGEQLAIFLDGESISEPVINEAITGGTATISGNFTPQEGRALVRDLNIGALPVPISLLSTESVGASLGADTLARGIIAGMWGYGVVALFMLLWYRLPGAIAVVALTGYMIMTLALFKLIGVTISAAGIAGLILSIGMAVDANVLIFERIKEELRSGKALPLAISEGFSRAWLAIRDGHFTALLSAIILFWVGTSVVEGFALIYAIGTLLSLVSGIVVSRTLLLALGLSDKPLVRRLFGSGFSR
jgi:protein-export membrane protein SecD